MNDVFLGKVFAVLDAESQAAFLNSVGRSLRRVCAASDGDFDLQILLVADRLDADGKALVNRLAAMLESDRGGR